MSFEKEHSATLARARADLSRAFGRHMRRKGLKATDMAWAMGDRSRNNAANRLLDGHAGQLRTVAKMADILGVTVRIGLTRRRNGP